MYIAAIKESLTFDDVTLIPQYSSILPIDTDISTTLASNIKLQIPFISSAMDTVTESAMAISMGKEGGMGVLHRNLNISEQCNQIRKVKKK